MTDSPWLDEATWEAVQRTVPITCVDLLPLRGGGAEVALVLRATPFGRYEAAIGSFYGQTNLATHIDLQNDPRLGDLEKQFIAMWDTESGGGLYNVFGLVSPYSEWGQWGLLNDVNASGSVKWNAVSSLVPATVGGPNPVPEPGTLGLLAAAAVFGCRRQRRAA